MKANETILLEHAYEAAKGLRFEGRIVSLERYGSGHINDTFLLVCDNGEERQKKYILQRINKNVFQEPELLMENIMGVTSFLKSQILERGGEPAREALQVIPAKDGRAYYLDAQSDYWRGYLFIDDTISYDRSESAADFYQSAVAFGRFQSLLAQYPAEKLHETIPHFHDTEKRYQAFLCAVEKDALGRVSSVKQEIEFVKEHAALAGELNQMLAAGALPLRVTHNDTKLNNVLIDAKTKKAICVIDLDTVMPGLAVNDFGDSIRFGASTAEEDEQDLSKVSCDLELFEAYTRGYLESCGTALTDAEIKALPLGAKMMTFECGMRFLTDYLEGDHYFRIRRPEHNLDRCRTQFKLVSDMEKKWVEMGEIVARLSERS